MHPVRRITAALRAARWGEIALELTLLVSGILIALAIDNWMDDRKAARSEHQYLQLLAGDLEQDLATLDETIQFEQAQVDAGMLAYRSLRRGIDKSQREAIAESDRRFADKVGVPVSVDDDGLWALPTNDPAWRVLAGRVWYRSLVSESAIEQSRTIAAEVRSVRASIAEEVSGRRWP